MFFTNDVALIAFVPLTAALFENLPKTMIYVITLQTAAANLGSESAYVCAENHCACVFRESRKHYRRRNIADYLTRRRRSLQTAAANLGSMLTPFGNPHNLYLYDRYKMNACPQSRKPATAIIRQKSSPIVSVST